MPSGTDSWDTFQAKGQDLRTDTVREMLLNDYWIKNLLIISQATQKEITKTTAELNLLKDI